MILVANSAYGKVALKLKFDVDYTSSTKADDTQEDESSSLNYGAYAGGGWLADSGLYLGLTAYLQTWNNSNSTTTAGVTTSTDGSNDFFTPGAQIGYLHSSGLSATYTYYLPSKEESTSGTVKTTEQRSFMELELAYGLSAGPVLIGPAIDIKRRSTDKTTVENTSTGTEVESTWKENVRISADILVNIWYLI